MLAAILSIHALAAVLAPMIGRRRGRSAFLVIVVAAVATLALALPALFAALGGEATVETYAWAADLGLAIELRLDGFAALMLLLVVGIEALVAIYAYGYFDTPREDLGRFVATLTAFAGAMLGLVLSDHLLLVFAFWELTSITSYLLIGTDDRRAAARSAALQALLTTAMGGLAMLAGFVMLGSAAGTYTFSELLANPPSGTVVEVALVLVLLGAFTKSAQVPFHAWLPGAMAAPTPVSAYLHSATMVKAGVYVIARFSPAFADSTIWQPLVLTVGAVTMLIGGWRALRQYDLKLVLAYGTISQLGFLTVLFGAGYPETTLAGVALLLAHAMFKASLFMTVGTVDHHTRTRDIRRLTGLHRTLRITALTALVAGASMAGLPPLFGFIAKEAAFEALLHYGVDTAGVILLAIILIGSILTVAYTARYLWGAFATKRPDELLADEVVEPEPEQPSWTLKGPALVLATLGLILGVLPALGSPLVVGAATALDSAAPDAPLALWHGFNLALGLSVVAVGLGVLAWVGRHKVAHWQGRFTRVPDAGDVYSSVVHGVTRLAERTTALVQNGSLPIYLAIILITVLVLPGGLLFTSAVEITGLQLVDNPMQTVVVVIVVAGALATAILRQRFAAVLALGAVGYSIAALFVIQGAPDLALTQLLIETLILVLFVLVLRHLPRNYRVRHFRISQLPRIVLAVGVGLFAMAFSAIAVAARQLPSVSSEYLTRALPEGGGRNVVNVILVDFRGFDTFGEIVVLTATALGVLTLVRAARRERRADNPPAFTQINEARIERRRYSVVLATGARVVFRPLLVLSLYFVFGGHNEPGGGFIGGLVAGAALILVAVTYGTHEMERWVRIRPEAMLGGGMLVSAASAAFAWIAGEELLTRVSTEVDIPLFGSLHVSTTVFFDIGVYLVVVGLVVAMLRSLGREATVMPT